MSNQLKQKQTINQVIETTKAQVTGINYMTKQSGTNVWYIQSKNASPEETALELKELGFKIVAVNLKNSMILAEKNL